MILPAILQRILLHRLERPDPVQGNQPGRNRRVQVHAGELGHPGAPAGCAGAGCTAGLGGAGVPAGRGGHRPARLLGSLPAAHYHHPARFTPHGSHHGHHGRFPGGLRAAG